MPINTDPPYDRLETILMGGTVDPPYTRKELIAMQAGGGSGGGGGEGGSGGVFEILSTLVPPENERLQLEKTAGEIIEAYENGMRIIITEDSGDLTDHFFPAHITYGYQFNSYGFMLGITQGSSSFTEYLAQGETEAEMLAAYPLEIK